MKFVLPLLVLPLALAACAGPRWVKPSATSEQATSDYSECNALAQEANRRDSTIETDILASRGRDWENNGTLSTHTNEFAAESQQRSSDVINSCMLAKGYTPAK